MSEHTSSPHQFVSISWIYCKHNACYREAGREQNSDSTCRRSHLSLISLNCTNSCRLPRELPHSYDEMGWCPQCKIRLNDMPSISCWSRHHHLQRYFHLSTVAAEEVGLWKIAKCLNSAITHAGCNMYSPMNADWVNQQIMGWLRDHTREWNTSFWKDISGQEKGLDLTNEQFSIIPWFSITCQVGDNRIPVNDWNSAEYIDWVKVSLAVLARCLTAHTDNSKFIKSVINSIFIASYHSHSETMLQKLQDALSGINSIIHLILTYFMSHSMSKIPEIHSLVHYTK